MFNFKYEKGAVFKYEECSSLNAKYVVCSNTKNGLFLNKKNVLLSNTKNALFLDTKNALLSNTKYVLVSNTENVCRSYKYINTKNRFMI